MERVESWNYVESTESSHNEGSEQSTMNMLVEQGNLLPKQKY